MQYMTSSGHPCHFHNVYLPNTGSVLWEIQQTAHLHSSQIFINSHSFPHSLTAISHFSLWVHPVSPTLLGSWLHHDTSFRYQGFCTPSFLINVHLKERFNNSTISHTPGSLKTTSSVIHSTLTLPNGQSIFEKTQLVRNISHSYIG